MRSDITDHDYAAEDTLGGRISLGRDVAGLSLEEAARRLGVLAETWRAWECDRDAPRSNRLTMMAGLLGVSPGWLLAGVGTGPVEQPTEPSADLLDALRQTSAQIAALDERMRKLAAKFCPQGLN